MHVLQIQKTDQTSDVVIPDSIKHVLDRFQEVFQEPTVMPPVRNCDHKIPLMEGARPVNLRPYRHTPALKDEIERQVTEMLQSGVTQNSNNAFSSPALLVKKKDGTWRLCIDYRHLNAITIKGKYPMPVIDELLDELSRAKYFSKLDLRADYHQIRLQPGEEHKTAFQTHSGHYEYRVMSFELTGAPATFQKAMNDTLATVLRKFTLVFFDDILIYSPDLPSHIQHLEQVLQLLQAQQWKVKLSKCSFAQQQLAYLGHIIGKDGVTADPSKIADVLHWKIPQSVKQLRGFLGLAGYYRKFVRNFGTINKPLTQLLKKGVPFKWTAQMDEAFNALKQALVSAPVLALPDFSKTFTVETDACDMGIGAVLSQDRYPIAFVSKALGPKTRGLSTYEKEYLAILLAVNQWRSYLQHDEFVILTDHHSLMHITDQRLHTPLQHKAFTKLMGLQYKVCYRRGTSNAAADALSRRDEETNDQLWAVSECQPLWLTAVVKGYETYEQAQQLLTELALHPTAREHFRLVQGVLRYKGKIWIGHNLSL